MVHFVHEKLKLFKTQVQLLMLLFKLPVHFLYFPLLCQFFHLIPVSGCGNDDCRSSGDHHIDQTAKPDIRISRCGKKQGGQPIDTDSVKRHRLNNDRRRHDTGNDH